MEINEIKAHLTIATVLKHYNLSPDKNGMLKCPFHEDKTPSLKIYSKTDSFNCFGCNAGGDVIEFIQLKDNCTKHAALKKAAEMCNTVETDCHPSKLTEKPVITNHTEILTKIFTTFQNGLSKSSVAKKYLESRLPRFPAFPERSRREESSEAEIGYNSAQFHHKGKLTEPEIKACIEAGLLIPTKQINSRTGKPGHIVFAKECLIFPLKNKQNQTVSFYGRNINGNVKNKHFYLKNRSGLYPNYPNPETKTLILTEAIIDAATLLQCRTDKALPCLSILSCYGTNGLTAEHLEALLKLKKLEEVIIFFDGDKPGTEAANKYATELNRLLKNAKISIVETPTSEDINSMFVEYGEDAILQLLQERKPFLLSEEKYQVSSTEYQDDLQNAKSVNSEQLSVDSDLQDVNPTLSTLGTRSTLSTSNPDYITYTTDQLKFTILGGINLQQIDRLRLTLKISLSKDALKGVRENGATQGVSAIRHTIDLYQADYLEKFITKASEQLEIGTTILRTAIAELTDQIENYRLKKLESFKKQKPKRRELTDERIKKAIKYLSSPNLLDRTNNDIGKTGMIGEANNRLLMYLVFTSRLREQPLHIISLGASGTGKTYLQEKISQLIPEHDKLEITILSENAFYYFEQKELKNKLVLIEDMDGAENVLYPLRELQSKRQISKTIPIKDSKGNLKTITLKVEGPICLAGTTTREKLYEDNANRSLLIYLDSSKNHKENIMSYQRKLSAGKIAEREEHRLKEFFKDMQTVLKPVRVRNPYAEHLIIPEHVFKPLRTNSHYLAFIETITFYHQYQREVKVDSVSGERYIETQLSDIEWANELLKDVLLAKADELSGECRSFFQNLKNWLRRNNKESFYKHQVREAFRMNPNNLKYYLSQLLKYNYIKVSGGSRYGQGFEYQVLNTQEYNNLKQNLSNALEAALNKIKKN